MATIETEVDIKALKSSGLRGGKFQAIKKALPITIAPQVYKRLDMITNPRA